MYKLLMIALAACTAVTAGAAQAQSYGPRPAYAAAGYGHDDECRGGRFFTLAGAHAGVTVLGIDVGASAGLHVSLHDRCGGGRPVVYALPPESYAPPPYEQPSYGPPPGYAAVGHPVQAYAPPPYAQPAYPQGYGQVSGYGYAYAAPTGYGYGPPPCGC